MGVFIFRFKVGGGVGEVRVPTRAPSGAGRGEGGGWCLFFFDVDGLGASFGVFGFVFDLVAFVEIHV